VIIGITPSEDNVAVFRRTEEAVHQPKRAVRRSGRWRGAEIGKISSQARGFRRGTGALSQWR